MLKLILVDDQPARAALLQCALQDNGCEVLACLASAEGLVARVAELEPDLVIIDLESPDRDTLENMAVLHRDNPRPVVMFTESDDTGAMERAMQAGVSAYVVDGLDAARVRSIIDVAIARFREFQALRNQLAEVESELASRNIINQAKALLMKHKRMDEEAAYHAMRKMAMSRGQRLVDVARNVVAVVDLIEPAIENGDC